jgi:hypothetical protein
MSKCPKCEGDVEVPSRSFGAAFLQAIGIEILAPAIFGLLLVLGLLWPPSLLIGFALAIYVFVVRKRAGATYICSSCGSELKLADLRHPGFDPD